MRRTDRSMRTATLSSCSRSVAVWAVAHVRRRGVSPERLHQDVGGQGDHDAPICLITMGRCAHSDRGSGFTEALMRWWNPIAVQKLVGGAEGPPDHTSMRRGKPRE
jgi:hypothetical protein